MRDSVDQFKLFRKLHNLKKYFWGLMILMAKKNDLNIKSTT